MLGCWICCSRQKWCHRCHVEAGAWTLVAEACEIGQGLGCEDWPSPDLAAVATELNPLAIHGRNTASSAVLHVHHILDPVIAVIIVSLGVAAACPTRSTVERNQELCRPAKPLAGESLHFGLPPSGDAGLPMPHFTSAGNGVVLHAFARARVLQALRLAFLQCRGAGHVVIEGITFVHSVATANSIAEASPSLPVSALCQAAGVRNGAAHKSRDDKQDSRKRHSRIWEHDHARVCRDKRTRLVTV
mmetsp:Transcript_109754/g.153788  ORF Transcript_109754/g.153788 Transcript_109754/m.153788 type:complete len:245 (+) Transcript_109754:170-904(+)